MALFPPGKGGGDGVSYGYKGKGILIHSITDANGMPVVAITTPANGDERQQVLPMLAQIRLATGKRGNPKRRPKTLTADKGYDARWLRNKLRTKGIRPQIKKRQIRGKKPKGYNYSITTRHILIQNRLSILPTSHSKRNSLCCYGIPSG
jgi:IS5 family transposase